jgi:hypothetical protein
MQLPAMKSIPVLVEPDLVQLFAKMSMATDDMQGYCYYNFDTCSLPPTIAINETQYFKPKPANQTTAPAPSGKTTFVLDHVAFYGKLLNI